MDDYKREFDRVNALASELTRDGIVFRIEPPYPASDDPAGAYWLVSWHFVMNGLRYGDCGVFTEPATDERIREVVAQYLADADETRAWLLAMTPEEQEAQEAKLRAAIANARTIRIKGVPPQSARDLRKSHPPDEWSESAA